MIHQGFLKLRIVFIFLIGAFFFLFILGRAVQLQLIPNKKLSELSGRQYKKAITLYPKRGTFYDRDMSELAVSRRVGSVYAYPKKIRNKRATAKKLSRLLNIRQATLYKKLTSKRSFVWIKRLAKDSVTAKLTRNPIKGVGLINEYKRFYPNQEIMGQVLGAVGIDSQGVEGLEYSFNDVLYGKKKSIVLLRDAHGRPVTYDKVLFAESQEGSSIVLSLDKSLQFLVEKELEAAVQTQNAKKGMALIQDANTGEILVMAHYPFFNPNTKPSYKNDFWKNRMVNDQFEPGSTFKMFLAASVLEEGIKSTQQFYCENGVFRVAKKAVIREAQDHKFGWLSFADIIKYSSNIGAAKLAIRLGKERFYEKIKQFGFGEKTNIGAPGEASGGLRPVDSWNEVDLTNVAFGQGVSVTALQMISAVSAIANGGKLMKPILVKKIVSASGEERLFEPEVVRQVVSASIAKKLTKLLTRVTEKGGTGFLASLDDYKVAGKTGTAQKPNLKTGGYYKDKYISSFVGFFPADKPKYSIFVMLDEPKKYYYASQVAAPLFKVSALHALQIFPPEEAISSVRTITKKEIKVKKKTNQVLKKALYNIEWDITRMPDLRGKSMREVLAFSTQAGLNLQIKGSGVAVKQSIKKGISLKPGQVCSVMFQAVSR